MSMKKTQTSKC